MEDVKETKKEQPMCHFTPMEFETADDWPNGQVSFWECKHCGHTKEQIKSLQTVPNHDTMKYNGKIKGK